MQVVDKFWESRENSLATPDDGQPQNMQPLDRAIALLLESDAQWTYGGCNREALQEQLKEARALAEENGLLANERGSRAIELDAQLVLLRYSHGYKKTRSSWDSFHHVFGTVACIGGGHSVGICTCLSPEVVVGICLLVCWGAYWAVGVSISG